MRKVYLLGTGQVPVTKQGNVRGRHMAARAITSALAEAQLGPNEVGALLVGNMMSGMLAQQQQLGALFAEIGRASCRERV